MGALRDRMQADLLQARRSPQTIDSYLGCARRFVEYHRRPPAEMGRPEVVQYLDHLVQERRIAASTQVVYLAALRFLYVQTLQRPDAVADLPRPRVRSRLPGILSREEIEQLFAATRYPLHRAAFLLGYSAGLRIGEVASLRIDDIDSRRGVLWVRHGKGDKDRQTLLPDALLEELRHYFRLRRPPGPYLFPSRVRAGEHMLSRSLHKALRAALDPPGVDRNPATRHRTRRSERRTNAK